MKKLACSILVSFVWYHISAGQVTYFNNENPFSYAVSSSDSGAVSSNIFKDFSSSAAINTEKNYQIPNQPSISFSQMPFQTTGFSSTLSPIESFISEFNAAVYTSKILPDIFDLRELAPEVYSKYLYNYVYRNCVDASLSNPHIIAGMVANPFQSIDTMTLPVMLDIYGNGITKYLFAKGILNSNNASYLAKKYVEILENNATLKWRKETPESKFAVITDGFAEYMTSLGYFNKDTIEDLANIFGNEVKRVGTKY